MRKPRSRWPALAATAVLTLMRGAPAEAAEPPAPPAADAPALDPATLLLFSVSLDNLTLSEGLGAYGDPADPLVPVGELARLLEADIDVLPPERRIVGRLGQARSSLLVDLSAGVARSAGRETPISAGDAAVTPTEIYLRVSQLRRLLGLEIEVADDELALRLHAREKFPVQARLERLANRPDGSQTGVEQDSLRVSEPYALFSPPGVDAILDTGVSAGDPNRSFRYDLRLAGDLLWSNFQGYLGSDEEGRATNARVLLQRRSIEGSMLGPLHAREVSLGDTYTPSLSIGPRSVSGRGFSFSTAPLEQTSVFNRIDLRGDLPPGFDVELYVNDVLRSSTNQAINGRFEFLDVPLSPGLNVLRVVTYGPRGERQEEVQVVNVGAGLLRPGEAQVQFGIVEQEHPVFQPRRVGRPLLGDTAVFASGGVRTVVSVNYGISSLATMSAGLARTPRPNGDAVSIYTLGLRGSILGMATQFDVGVDDNGGQAASLGAAGMWGPLSGVLRHAEYRDGFIDENNLGFNSQFEMRRRTEITVDSSLNLRGRIVPVSMRALRNEYAGGSYDFLAAARASSSVGQVLLSAGLEYQRQVYRPTPATEILRGYITATTFRGYTWQIRTSLDYDVLPNFKARFLALTVDRKLSDTWSVRFGLGQPLDDLDRWNVVLSSILATRYGDFALTGEYDNMDDDWRLAAQWNFGLGYDPARRRYDLMRTGPGTGGSVLFNAFIDENGDGVRQANEAPAPNVALDAGGQRGVLTGPDGRVFLTGLGGGPSSSVDVSLDRIDNPSVAAPPSKVRLRPRPGGVTRVDYPLRPTGGVAVKVELLRDDGARVGLASVRLQLVKDDGQVVDAVSEFDGSAIFDAVPVGAWRLRLDPRQAEKLRMRLTTEPAVKIAGDGEYAPDVAVQVRFDPAPPDTAVAKAGGGG
ncbi:MAG: hypothetical protein JNL41_03525 [Phenylobacterium sp.]|uniref:hypothetical protein n=1 Tax=Phenylobacterium sp. TaxID=1871053 RepID=UPI001A54343A|nr:hypothetical protein [Phenylobacterium sp.]MBL8553324.1 hypothetical protein [Phenylobacterium sp.]